MKKNSGLMVETKSGKRRRTYDKDELINGKYPVYLVNNKFEETGERLLCSPENLKVIGYID